MLTSYLLKNKKQNKKQNNNLCNHTQVEESLSVFVVIYLLHNKCIPELLGNSWNLFCRWLVVPKGNLH
jgi:hypothetical protein